MLLQLALDWGKIDDLFALAHTVGVHVDWIEVGTPLIKQHGTALVARTCKEFPEHTILADMKTADGGPFEVDLAADAGAHVMTVLAAASDATVRASIARARERGIKVVVDLIGQPDPVARARQLAALKPDYFNLHRSTDAMQGGVDLRIDLISDCRSSIAIPLSVAGGIDLKTVKSVRDAGASVIVVGGAITSAKDPAAVAKQMKESIR
jgi:3-hexulose-6-phosphate synthase